MTSTQPITSQNEARIRRGYDALSVGDMAAFRELFTPDVKWHVPGRNALSGTKQGIEGFIEYFGELVARTDGTFRAELVDVLANEHRGFGFHIDTASRLGRSLSVPIVIVFRFDGDRVCEAWEHYQDQTVVDSFFA